MTPRLVVTPGDPRGVGPEVTARALERFVEEQAGADVCIVGPEGPLGVGALAELAEEARAADGTLDSAMAGSVAARSIEYAVRLAMDGRAHAIVTAPLHKPSLHAAGWEVPGQTEMLAELSGAPRVGMLMAAERTRLGAPLRVLLATTHLSLRQAVDAVTSEVLVNQIELLHEALATDWGFAEPRIGVCAMNPHASDGGLFGDEEALVYAPALAEVRARGIRATGPLPADTVFSRALAGAFDAVVAPYHDVGMAAFKTVSFGAGVNVTLGLPFPRTSPDHGTAFDLAGLDRADPRSTVEALRLATRLARARDSTRAL